MTTNPPQNNANWSVIATLAAARFIMDLNNTVMNVNSLDNDQLRSHRHASP